MTLVPAAAPVRLLTSALVALAVLASVLAGRAEGASGGGTELLAPAGACHAADDPFASHRDQIRAVSCLLNWARAEVGHAPLARRPALQRAATLKGRRVASCGQFTHTPCGSAVTAAVKASGYRYGWFGENLFAGTWRRTTAREVVRSWLGSAPHRANVLRPQFRHVGVAPVKARGLLDGTDAVVWTATFASPR